MRPLPRKEIGGVTVLLLALLLPRSGEARPGPRPGMCAWHADPACDDQDPCTRDFCIKPVCHHHRVPAWYCCQSDADCDDDIDCTEDTCVDNRCFHELRLSSPVGELCCTEDSECTDTDRTTVDLCIKNRCVNPIGSCHHCAPGDPLDLPTCDDGNPCTQDVCFSCCRHLPPGLWIGLSPVAPGYCCRYDEDCLGDDVCRNFQCAPSGS